MKRGIITMLVFVFMAADFAFSQNPWSDHENRTSASFEMVFLQFNPDFMGNVEKGWLTNIRYVDVRIRLNDHVFLLTEVPYSHYEWRLKRKRAPYMSKQSERGNPFIGAELRLNQISDGWSPFISMGTYLPKKDNIKYSEKLSCSGVITRYSDKYFHGFQHNVRLGAHPALLTDFTRGEAFWPDVWSVRFNAGTTKMFSDNRARIWLSTGVIHNIYRGDWAELLNRETYLTYTAHLSSFFDGFTINASLFGRSPLGVKVIDEIRTVSNQDIILMRTLDFADDTLLQFRLGLEKDISVVSIGAYFSEPLSSGHRSILKRSFGFTVGVHI
jgi:hypothetical protein